MAGTLDRYSNDLHSAEALTGKMPLLHLLPAFFQSGTPGQLGPPTMRVALFYLNLSGWPPKKHVDVDFWGIPNLAGCQILSITQILETTC